MFIKVILGDLGHIEFLAPNINIYLELGKTLDSVSVNLPYVMHPAFIIPDDG
jgi:hypothetical protein